MDSPAVVSKNRPAVVCLDALFVAGWLGFFPIYVSAACKLSDWLRHQAAPQGLFTDWGNQVFWVEAALWLLLGGTMIVICHRSAAGGGPKDALWRRLLLWNWVISGPTAYYFGRLRRRLLGDDAVGIPRWLEPRVGLLDALCFVYYWGLMGTAVCVGAGFLLAPLSITITVSVLVAVLLLPPVCVFSAMILRAILLMDATERTPEQWRETDFVQLLGPWGWVDGIRKYYLKFLRARLRPAAPSSEEDR